MNPSNQAILEEPITNQCCNCTPHTTVPSLGRRVHKLHVPLVTDESPPRNSTARKQAGQLRQKGHKQESKNQFNPHKSRAMLNNGCCCFCQPMSLCTQQLV